MAKWESIPLENQVFQNVKETVLTKANAALENGYINEAGGHTRFAGIKDFVDIPDGGLPYLHEWQGDLFAATDRGSAYTVSLAGDVDDKTGVTISGGRRVIFSRTKSEILMAAGGRIIKYAGPKTEILSEDAPESTHVAFISGFVVAIEKLSERFQHANAGVPDKWDALDVFAAEGNPDNLLALIKTPFNELLLCGVDSIEQFETFPSGVRPFVLRYTVGDGLRYPYSLISADNGNFGINKDNEIVRFAGQSSVPISEDFGAVIEGLDDKSDVWGERLHIGGQKFLIWKFPNATNPYGTKGVTLLFDYRAERFFNLYGWDEERGIPEAWPAQSIYTLEGRHFVGLQGKIGELDTTVRTNLGKTQRMHYRSAHISDWGESQIDNVRMRVKRGGSANSPVIRVRFLKDDTKATNWVEKSLGSPGERRPIIDFGSFGTAYTWQMQYEVTDDAEVEIVNTQALVQRIGP